MERMSLRTVLIVLACILIAAPIIAAGADDPDQATKPAQRPAAPAAPDGVPEVKRAIVADDDIIRARVGQRLELTVEARTVDSVQAFGQTEAVTPESPANFSIQLDEAGTHGIVLVSTDERIGRIVVTEPEKEPAAPQARPKQPERKPEPRRSPPSVSGGTAPDA